MTYADHRRPPARRRPPPRRRRRAWPVLLVLLVVIVALGLLLFDGRVWERIAGTSATSSERSVAAPEDVTLDELLDRAVDNGDGTMTVTVSEAEAGGLVRDGLRSGGTPALRDVTVDLQEPDGSAPGQMQLDGRMRDQDVPVTAVVDLAADGGTIEPTVRDVRVGPLPVPGSVRRDLNRQLRDVSLLGAAEVDVEQLRTTDSELEVTGRRR